MHLVLVDNFFLGVEEERPSAARLGPHLGLLSLIAVAQGAGHQATLVDPSLLLVNGDVSPGAGTYDAMAAHIVAAQPDVVGFTSLGCNFVATVRMAMAIKARAPSLPVILGGPHPSIMAREIIERFQCVDVVVRHEAEQILLPLLRALQGVLPLEAVAGVTFRGPGGVVETKLPKPIEDLDDLPMPAWEHWPIAEHDFRFFRVEIGRGCPYACSFCSTSAFFDRRYRLKSPQRVVEELDLLAHSYGIRRFELVHDMLTLHRDVVETFCDLVADRGYLWSCSARIDRVDKHLLQRMKGAGCQEVYYGIETGSPRLQRLLNKNLDLHRMQEVVADTISLEMHAVVSFITGFPQETLQDQAETLDVIGSLVKRHPSSLSRILLHNLVPLAGTRLLAEHRDALRHDGAVTDRACCTQDALDVELVHSDPNIFVDYHYLQGVLPRARYLAVAATWYALEQLGHEGIAWLLHATGRTLAELVDEADPGPAEPSEELPWLEAFVVDLLGPAHPIRSLIRYKRALRASARGARSNGLAAGVVLVADLHDVPELIQRLHAPGRSGFPGTGAACNDWLVLPPRPDEPDRTLVRLSRDQATVLRAVVRGGAQADVEQEAVRCGHAVAEVQRFLTSLRGAGALPAGL